MRSFEWEPRMLQLCAHAGDSACVIPPQTVSQEVQDKIRSWTKAIAKELKVSPYVMMHKPANVWCCAEVHGKIRSWTKAIAKELKGSAFVTMCKPAGVWCCADVHDKIRSWSVAIAKELKARLLGKISVTKLAFQRDVMCSSPFCCVSSPDNYSVMVAPFLICYVVCALLLMCMSL